MSLFRQHTSICRTVLLTIFLELTIVNKCTSYQDICITSNRRNISYFEADLVEVDWNRALQECIKRKSILPVICNQDEQDALMKYLNATIGSSEAWTSGKMIYFNKWTWIDGQPFIGIIPSQDESYTHVVLDETRRYKAQSSQRESYFLCQYSGSRCNDEKVIHVTYGCVWPNNMNRAWSNARSHCLSYGGNLAKFSGDDVVTLKRSNKLIAGHRYWIGLQKIVTSQWIWQSAANSSEVNWLHDTHSSRDECISINASNGEWKLIGCSDKKKVICEGTLTSVSYERDYQSLCTTTLISLVIGSICTIVISNIIVALVVRKYIYRRCSHVASSSETTENRAYQDLEMTRRQANPDDTYTELRLQPVYEICQREN